MQFGLYNPTFSDNHEAVEFDLTPGEDWLKDGTRELMQACLDTMGFDNASPDTWDIVPFCSPFFSTPGRLEHFRDRNAPAWRVRLRLGQVHRPHALPNLNRSAIEVDDALKTFQSQRKSTVFSDDVDL